MLSKDTTTKIEGNDRVLFKQFTDEIDTFYRQCFRYKGPCAHGRFPTVDISRSPVRLYLRFNARASWPATTVVIAAIQFQDQRRGHGQALLAKLVEMSGRYGYTNVGIEQTSDGESIQNFVRKFGFVNHRDSQNWILPVASLADRFAALQEQAA